MEINTDTARGYLEYSVQNQVQSLFKRAQDLFSEELQEKKKLFRRVLYVAYMLRRCDLLGENIYIELQYCLKEDSVAYEFFLRTIWFFPGYQIDNIWSSVGLQTQQARWQCSMPTLVMRIFDLECLKQTAENTLEESTSLWQRTSADPLEVSKELETKWQTILSIGVLSMLL